MNSPRPLSVLCLLSSVFCLPAAFAALELAPPFTDHAVLQREVSVPVWGWSDRRAGDPVTVEFAGQKAQTTVNAAGVWRAELDAMPANATGGDLVVTDGSATITLHDVVVGEVWLASGQSNMEWGMDATRGYAEEKTKPANPLVRQLRVDHVGADLPVGRVKHSGWKVAGPDTLGRFSGVAYFFAKMLSEKLNVPVGLINASWGGTPIESWIPEGTLRGTRAWLAQGPKMAEAMKLWPERYAAQPGLEAAWNKAQADLKNNGTPIPAGMQWPRPPMGPGSGFMPARLFNGMIAPFIPYALRGAVWYQGESNVGRHHEYTELLPAMIGAWRAAWPLGDFPFLVVQLPAFSDNGKATGRAWAQLREAQESALHVPGGAVAVTIDNDEPDNLHPVNKRPVGERLALIALNQIHGRKDLVFSGPVFQSLSREGAALRVRFSFAEGLKSTTPTVTGFEIAGADQVFQPAAAQIDGTTVVLSSPAVPDPVAVRYAYTNAPPVSLFNAAGLPAAPFRTDDW